MAKIKARKKSKRQEVKSSGGPNWLIIGPIIGIGAIALIALAIVGVMNPSVAAEPTPVLGEVVTNATTYCEENEERCIIFGNPDSDVTMIEVVDYGCPHCANFNATKAPTLLENYVDTNQVRWMVMPFALGPQSRPSAAAVMCVNEQGADLALHFHEDLFLLQRTADVHTRAGFISVANRVEGIDVEAFESCLDDGRRMTDVSFNQQAARSLGVQSTPSFFLNGRLMSGDQDLTVFTANIDAALN
ncbi:MAG: thioredoxin domain-containing protein [Chloroflexota bacterium]